jgi:hypothetical protein
MMKTMTKMMMKRQQPKVKLHSFISKQGMHDSFCLITFHDTSTVKILIDFSDLSSLKIDR